MKIFLHDDIAAAGERSILLADEHGVDRYRAAWILRPVDETQEIAIVEVTEAVDFVDWRNRICDARHNLRGQFEA